jgi:hypothetical protein
VIPIPLFSCPFSLFRFDMEPIGAENTAELERTEVGVTTRAHPTGFQRRNSGAGGEILPSHRDLDFSPSRPTDEQVPELTDMQRLEEKLRALTELVVGQSPPHPPVRPSLRSTPAPPRSTTSAELVFEEGLYPVVARDPRFTSVLDYRTFRLEDKSLYFTADLLKATQLLHNTLPKFDGMEGALILHFLTSLRETANRHKLPEEAVYRVFPDLLVGMARSDLQNEYGQSSSIVSYCSPVQYLIMTYAKENMLTAAYGTFLGLDKNHQPLLVAFTGCCWIRRRNLAL